MNRIYNWCGGRKIFFFFFLFVTNFLTLLSGKWEEGFGYFSIGLYSVVVLGIEGNKYIIGKNDKGNS